MLFHFFHILFNFILIQLIFFIVEIFLFVFTSLLFYVILCRFLTNIMHVDVIFLCHENAGPP